MIIHNGLQRMYADQEDVYFYLTLMNENYAIPTCRWAPRRASSRGSTGFLRRSTKANGKKHVNLMGSGTILVQAMRRPRC